MAKVVAPLLSFGGTGQIGKSIVFADWRGVQYARRYVIPANPQTTDQQFNRNSFATLREMWKRLSTDGRAPWDAYAQGQKFLGLNAFIGENRLSIGTETDMQLLIGSPGAKGGIPLSDFAAAAGSSSGEIDMTFTLPSLPTGWTAVECVVLSIRDQAPNVAMLEPPTVTTSPYGTPAFTVSGLTAGESYVNAGWFTMTKPDGVTAYSASQADTATALA